MHCRPIQYKQIISKEILERIEGHAVFPVRVRNWERRVFHPHQLDFIRLETGIFVIFIFDVHRCFARFVNFPFGRFIGHEIRQNVGLFCLYDAWRNDPALFLRIDFS